MTIQHRRPRHRPRREDRPARETARNFLHVLLRVTAINAERVQFHQFARVVFIDAAPSVLPHWPALRDVCCPAVACLGIPIHATARRSALPRLLPRPAQMIPVSRRASVPCRDSARSD